MHNYSICVQNCFCYVLTVFFSQINVVTEVVPFCKSGHILIKSPKLSKSPPPYTLLTLKLLITFTIPLTIVDILIKLCLAHQCLSFKFNH